MMATEKRRLIDANALKKAIRSESWVKRSVVNLTLQYIGIIIDEQPTVDAVEVVRCKDCKHGGILEHNGKMFCKEPMGCLGCVPTKPDAFCSCGERKDDDD